MGWATKLFANLFLPRTRKTTSRRSRPAIRRARPAIEYLESRNLLAALQVSISPHTIVENTGPSSTAVATVTRIGTDNSQPLTVSLASSNSAEATVPGSVVIPANQASTTFNVTAVPDSVPDVVQTVTVTGTAQLPGSLSLDPTFNGGSVAPGGYTEAVAIQADGKIVSAGLWATGGPDLFKFAVTRYNPNGTLDTSFGGGTVLTSVSGQADRPYSVVVQQDGKIVVAGFGGNGLHYWDLARYNPNGTLDASFGNGGTVSMSPTPGEIWDMALQADGKILVSGYIQGKFAVGRFNTNGTLNSTFGTAGIATCDPSPGFSERAYGVAVDSSGRIVLAGASREGNFDSQFVLARFTPAGVLDTTFGGTGVVQTDVPGDYEGAAGLVLQPDGKIVAVGYTSPAGTFPPVYRFALARYNADGTLDTGFGANGFTITDFGGTSQAARVALKPDGRLIVVGGGAGTSAGSFKTIVASYSPSGSLLGSVTAHTGVLGKDVALQSDGRIVVASEAETFSSYVDRYTDVNIISGSDTVNVQDNPSPTVVNHSYSTNQNVTLNVGSPGLLAGAFDPGGLTLTAIKVTDPAHGTVAVQADGSFVYTPAHDYFGSDSFTYKANDGTFDSNVATASITVNPNLPVAVNDAYSVDEDTTLNVPAPGVLANDIPGNSTPLTASLVTGVSHGSLTLNANGSFTYTPATHFHGTDTFTYRDLEGSLQSSPATVTITVNFVNQPPVAVDDSYTVNEDSTLSISAASGTTSLYFNSQPGDFIGQGQTHTWTPTTGTFGVSRNYDNGVSFSYQDHTPSVWWYLDFAAPNHATITPGVYANATRFPFQGPTEPGLAVYGEGRGSNTLTGNFTVTQAVYDSAGNVQAFDATFEQHSEGAPPALFGEIKYNAGALGVLANDSDPDGDPLTAHLVTAPSHGSLTFRADGTFDYTPDADYVGTDTFTYRANDGTLDSNLATVTITVNAVTDPTPVLTLSGGASANEESTYTLGLAAVDADPIAHWTVTWGDGSVQTVAGNPASVTHVYAQGPNNYTISATATDTDGTYNATNTIAVTVNPVQMIVSGPSTATAGAAFDFTVTVLDQQSSVDTAYAGTIHFTSSDGGAIVPADYTFVPGDAGTHVFSSGATLVTAGLQTVTAADTASGSITDTLAVDVSPGAAALFSVTGLASSTVAGTAQGFTVTALDAYNNVATAYTGTVQFTSSDGQADLPSPYTFTAADGGVQTFSATLKTAGTQSVTVSDSGTPTITGSQTGLLITNAPATQFRISAPANVTAGIAFALTVTALDAYGNVAVDYAGTIHFATTDGQGSMPNDYTFVSGDNGVQTFSIILRTPGTQTITVTDLGLGSITGSLDLNVQNP
jgi:uncharacterized delta-60 repeat protein